MSELSKEELRRLQLTLLEILKVIDAFCKQNGIAYVIDSGTALGARRHGGFIPWDDDIDVAMMREDYDRFVALAADGLPAGYSLHTFETTPGYAGMFAKVYKDGTVFATDETIETGCEQGIFVDVFAYDALSSDETERKRQMSKSGLWQRVSYLYHARHITLPYTGALGAIANAGCVAAHHAIRLLFTREGIRRRYFEAGSFAAAPSHEVCNLVYPETTRFDRDVLVPPRPVMFEGSEFPAPAQLERYLEIMYGPTWSELPPEEKRRTHRPRVLTFGD